MDGEGSGDRSRVRMEFRCRLGTDDGRILERVRAADNEALLRAELEREGLYVFSLRRLGGLGLPDLSGALARMGWRRRRPRLRELTVFNQELAVLLHAGMPVVQSLDILRQRMDAPALRAILDDVYEQVRGGAALSEAFASHGDMVPGVYTASLLAGEQSGNLEATLRRYVDYTRVISGVRRRTLSALIYPAILLALSVAVVAIIMVQVVPEFASFYEGMGATLPLATRLLTAVSAFVAGYAWLILLAAAGAGVALWAWMGHSGHRAQVDRVLLNVPVAGRVATTFATSQFARTLATLLGGGIPLVQALEVTARAVGNLHIAEHLRAVARDVREGQPLATSMAARGPFPPVAIKMVEVGESTGALGEMLNAVADFFDEEIETTLARFLTLMEPLLLVVMGVVIAGLLLALYMPLLQLGAIV